MSEESPCAKGVFAVHAPKYREHGLSVIPLLKNSKKPRVKEWNRFCTKAASDAQFSKFMELGSGNLGLCLGQVSGVVAVDVDVHIDKPIESDLLEEIMATLPDQEIGKSGEKGITLFYKYEGQKTERVDAVINGEKLRVFDLLSDGTQTVMPPSIHPDTGRQYEWLSEKTILDVRPQDLPALNVETIKELKRIVSRYDERTTKAKVISGRNDKLKAMAIGAIHGGKSLTTIVDELLAYDTTHHAQPLFSDSTEYTDTSMAAYDNALSFVKSLMKTVERGVRTKPEKRTEWSTLGELLEKTSTTLPWLVEELFVVGGVSFLCGKPKAGKSTLAKYLIRCVLFGKDFLGRKTTPGRVMLLSCEDVATALAKDFEDLKDTVAKDNLLLSTDLLQMDRDSSLVEKVEEFKPDLIIVDTLGGIPGIQDINDYTKTRNALRSYENLAQRAQTHILFLHHANKSKESANGDSMLGSTAIRGIGYVNIFIEKQRDYRVISSENRYGRAIEKSRIVYDAETRSYKLSPLEEFDIELIKNRVIDCLNDNTVWTAKSLREQLMLRNEYLTKALGELSKEGAIQSVGVGTRGDPKAYCLKESHSPH